MASSLIPNTKFAFRNLGDVCILGKGVTGNALYGYLKTRAERYFSLDFLDGDEINQDKKYNLTIISPGISQFSDIYKTALEVSDEVISEIEFAYRESETDSKWVAITGTNGKTTTTALTCHILNCCGKNAVAVGNIGDAAITKVDGNAKIYVLECSSYQLASIKRFKPDASTILNITPDHLVWHDGFENYARAKMNIFKNFSSLDYAILPKEAYEVILDNNLMTTELSSCMDERSHFVEFGNCDLGNDQGLDYYKYIQDIADEMQIKGEHNIDNAYVSLALGLHMGLDLEKSLSAIKSFSPLEHRIESCGEVRGVKFYNDSKATNVDSVIKALSAFSGDNKNVHLLLGGKDKLSDLHPLINAIDESSVREVVLYGASRTRFLENFQTSQKDGLLQDCVVHEANCMRDATMLAYANSVSGDVVLLSPACASFDEFRSFEHRGEVFKEVVKGLD